MTQPDTPPPPPPSTRAHRTTKQVQDLIERLRAPPTRAAAGASVGAGGQIDTADELLAVLAPVLDGISLLPPPFRGYLRRGLRGGVEEGIMLDAGGDKDKDGDGKEAGGIRRHIQPIQRVLLEEVVPTWGAELLRLGPGGGSGGEGSARGGLALIDQFFCPDAFVNGSRAAGEVARAAYATLVSVSPSVLVPPPVSGTTSPENEDGRVHTYALHILARLAMEYPLDRVYKAVFPIDAGGSGDRVHGREPLVRRGVQWEDCVRDMCKVPVVVANAVAGAQTYWRRGDVPEVLENAVYFDRMSVRFEELVAFLSSSSSSSLSVSASAALEPLTYLLTKLVHIGVFPAHPPVARSQPSFFLACLPAVRKRLALASSFSSSSSTQYSVFWVALFQNLAASSSITLQSILSSLFSSITIPLTPSLPTAKHPTLTQDPPTRARIAREAALLRSLVGRPDPERTPGLWQIATGLVVGRDGWPLGEVHARVFVAWVAGGGTGSSSSPSVSSSSSSGSTSTAEVDVKGTVVLDAFLGVVLDLWASPEHIKHSLLSRHRYTTALLLLTISYLSSPFTSTPFAPVQNLVSSPTFIGAIGTYIAHLDPAVRRCGMLAAEVVAHLCGRKLDFGGWDAAVDGNGGGDGEGLVWCREMRALLRARDVDVDVGIALAEEDTENAENENVEMEDISTPAAAAAATALPPARATFLPKPSDGYDSDDSLTGYASPPSSASSRSASPTPSELAEIEKDPTLSVGAKKVPRPVYLAQLGELLRATAQGAGGARGPNDAHDADRVQMALDCAEGLIRRKMGYGTELEENAINLVHAFLSLQDNFDLDGFSEKRQAAMNALVACAPTKATPTLIQEFFKNQYSTDQRFVALNALAMGARELADLPVPPTPSTANPARTTFPSKLLPGPLHRKYLSASDVPGGTGSRLIADRADRADRELLPRMVEQLATDALDEHRTEAAKAAPPALIRERRLRVQKPQLVSELPAPAPSTPLNPFSRNEFQTASATPPAKPRRPKFIDIAAEHFILPLISAFWAFLRDSQALERRTAHLAGRARYHGAGTGLVLNPMVLAQLVRTLAVLVHAARNAREWMAVVAPDALEVSLTLGTRPVSNMEEDGGDDEAGGEGGREAGGGPAGPSKEAALLTATLELALVVLNGALELDSGRVLGLEHTALVLGAGEWAGKVFAGLERGLRVQGGGGAHEARLSRAATGVVLKVDELTSKWSRSMIDL